MTNIATAASTVITWSKRSDAQAAESPNAVPVSKKQVRPQLWRRNSASATGTPIVSPPTPDPEGCFASLARDESPARWPSDRPCFGSPVLQIARPSDCPGRGKGGRMGVGRDHRMDIVLEESVSLLVRWLHVIAGICWIGSSFYFVALDLSLKKRDRFPEGAGREALHAHGRGVFNMVKVLVAAARLPDALSSFQGEAYTTPRSR